MLHVSTFWLPIMTVDCAMLVLRAFTDHVSCPGRAIGTLCLSVCICVSENNSLTKLLLTYVTFDTLFYHI